MACDIDFACVGGRVSGLRQERRMTRESLAEAVGVNRSTIYRIETGRTQGLTTLVLARLARTLQTTTDYLLFG